MKIRTGKIGLLLLLLFLTGCGGGKRAAAEYPQIAAPSDAEWVSAVFVSEGIYCIFDGEKYGYMTEEGKEIAPCIYDLAYPFSEGLACVFLAGKYGYIDTEGATAIPFVYDCAAPFAEGLAYFADGDAYGFMDQSGALAFHFTCDSISSFQEGAAFFSSNGRYGYIDQMGHILIEPVFDDAGYFHDGLAQVRKDGRCGMINQKGDFVIEAAYDRITTDGPFILAQSGGTYEGFDRRGKSLTASCDDLTVEGQYLCFRKNGRQEIVDEKGNSLTVPSIDGIVEVLPEQKLLLIKDKQGYGVADWQGVMRIPAEYSYIRYDSYRDHTGGMLVLTGADGKVESVDAEDLSRKIPGSYDTIDWLEKDKAIVGLNGQRGMIDREGERSEQIWGVDEIIPNGDCYQVLKDGNYGFLNEQGEIVIPLIYDCVSSRAVFGDTHVCVLTNYDEEIREVVVRTGDAEPADLSAVLLQNEITPEAGSYYEFTKSGSIRVDGIPDESTVSQEDLRAYKKTYKLYDWDHSGEPLLFFMAEPYETWDLPMSYSGLFERQDDQLVELLSGCECGGSMGGDYVCFWYDRETSQVLPGTSGLWGGFGGYSSYAEVYDRKGGEQEQAASFSWLYQPIAYFSGEELERAELVYDMEGQPYTKEEIESAEEELAEIYYVNGKQTTIEAYREMCDRYDMLMEME